MSPNPHGCHGNIQRNQNGGWWSGYCCVKLQCPRNRGSYCVWWRGPKMFFTELFTLLDLWLNLWLPKISQTLWHLHRVLFLLNVGDEQLFLLVNLPSSHPGTTTWGAVKEHPQPWRCSINIKKHRGRKAQAWNDASNAVNVFCPIKHSKGEAKIHFFMSTKHSCNWRGTYQTGEKVHHLFRPSYQDLILDGVLHCST